MNRYPKLITVDTNVLVHDPEHSLEAFADNEVVLSIYVIEELDNLKSRPGEAGFAARAVSRQLEEMRKTGSLVDGIPTKGGGLIRVELNGNQSEHMPSGLSVDKVDNHIVALARHLKAKEDGKREVLIVSKDINVRLKAGACDIKAEDYTFDKIKNLDELYTGTATFAVSDDIIQDLMSAPDCSCNAKKYGEKLQPNECCFLQPQGVGDSILAIYNKPNNTFKLVRPDRKDIYQHIQPRNAEQTFAYNLSMNPNIKLLTLTGIAGTGKTLFAVKAALAQLGSVYENVIIFRPNKEIGDELGFLPGDIGDKFGPWTRPIIKCMNLILGNAQKSSEEQDDRKVGMFEASAEIIKAGYVEILPLNYIRGDTFMNSLIIFDEAQNSNNNVMKTLVTRVGEGSKIILLGDLEQIDDKYIDAHSSGLTRVIHAFPGQEEYANLRLVKSERSQLAQKAAKLL